MEEVGRGGGTMGPEGKERKGKGRVFPWPRCHKWLKIKVKRRS